MPTGFARSAGPRRIGRKPRISCHRRPGWRGALIASFALTLIAQPRAAVAEPGDIGFQDHAYGTAVSTPTGTKRNESLLWFNDGSWWAHMWDTDTADYHIFRLEAATQTWVDTGTATDVRATTHADTLWDGTHLYVASHGFVSDESPSQEGTPSRLYRYSYDTVTDTYRLDLGFPSQINNVRTETLVIDKDSTGQLWATWQQDNQIYVNTTLGDDLVWGVPFALPVAGTAVTVDDTSAVVAFGGNKIGVMWSSQTASEDGMWFAVHVDGQPATVWEASSRAIAGVRSADDHMSLKALADGRILAAIKSEHTTPGLPLVSLLERTTAGSWSTHTVGLVQDCHNRPSVLVDTEHDLIHVLATAPAPGGTCNTSGGAIYEKTSPLDAISFAPGLGTPVILDADNPTMHNVTSTKQNLTSGTGLVGLAINAGTDSYWHHVDALGGTPPPPNADFRADQRAGTAPFTVVFTDTSTGAPSAWSWSFGDGATSNAQHPTHEYTQPGTYTVTLTATNATGSNTEQGVGYITVAQPAPDADFTASPTTGTAPLTVAFSDQSTEAPTSWSWSFGDGGTSTLPNPTHQYTQAGTYTVSLTATNAAGPNTEQKVGLIRVNAPPPGPNPTPEFGDAKSSIFRADIAWALAERITTGCAVDRYCPDAPVTRAQMASFLARALDLPATSRDFFTDDESSIHEADINRLAAARISTGCTANRYCPGANVSRQEMASFLARAFHLPATPRDFFTDDESSIHEPDINRLAADGVASGCGAGRYCPRDPVTRGQMAAFLHRAMI